MPRDPKPRHELHYYMRVPFSTSPPLRLCLQMKWPMALLKQGTLQVCA